MLATTGVAGGTVTAIAVDGVATGLTAGTEYEIQIAARGGYFDFGTGTFGAATANATSTLLGFTAGFYSLASSTIGDVVAKSPG